METSKTRKISKTSKTRKTRKTSKTSKTRKTRKISRQNAYHYHSFPAEGELPLFQASALALEHDDEPANTGSGNYSPVAGSKFWKKSKYNVLL